MKRQRKPEGKLKGKARGANRVRGKARSANTGQRRANSQGTKQLSKKQTEASMFTPFLFPGAPGIRPQISASGVRVLLVSESGFPSDLSTKIHFFMSSQKK